ncbi:putative 4-hydroxy-2-oxoglutarate aldolase, mitochondrial [Purpureocillium lavendulum]|uniref:4-hydroxy-2-oxoglutarate aldolase, mitochondrial n=1 Tax=Purpureocillium lavendulum TaxID=1247861 RepID=A0AB34FTG3_9HYPO|nr:putative 4-hydroxy-2-oxoglutarate aldolase, mitochondrial [Purpureocillium lavendulum]
MMGSKATAYPKGIHVPCLTWFEDLADQCIDWDLQARHIEFLVNSGIHGVVLAGTNGEGATLRPAEKEGLIKMTRRIAQSHGRPGLTIAVGTSGQCTRDIAEDCRLAKDAGADYVLVLTPSYFHFAMTSKAIVSFFEQIGDLSPLPVLIYNFPGVTAGLDVDSQMLDRLAGHPNIVGVKLTCGGIGKVARIAASHDVQSFVALAGQSDWLVPALSVGAVGTITGVGNLYPKVCIQIFELFSSGNVEEAKELQLHLAKMEWGFAKGGVNGTKWVVAKLKNYPERSWRCRDPYPEFVDPSEQAWMLDTVVVKELVTIEDGDAK